MIHAPTTTKGTPMSEEQEPTRFQLVITASGVVGQGTATNEGESE